MIGMKKCSRCGSEKSKSEFHADSSRKDGLCRYCKECKRAIDRKTYEKDPRSKIARATENAKKNGWYFVAKPYNPAYYTSDSSKKKKRARDLNRRALHRTANGRITRNIINIIINKYGGSCAYCGIECGDLYTIDHKVPLAKGGSNLVDNLALACRHCNCSKNDKTDLEFCGHYV